MNTFNRIKKSTEDLFGGVKDDFSPEVNEIKEDNLGEDNEFEFDVPEESEKNVIIDDDATEAVENPYEIAKMNITRIGEDTIITGNVRTKGHIDILGTIKGNIDAEGNIAIRSDIDGNVKGNNIGMGTCVVKGDVEATKNILTDSESNITGNVKGAEISIAGHLSGDLKAEKVVVFKKEAVMEGDIETDGLVVEPGAIINGQISISRKRKKVEEPKVEIIEESAVVIDDLEVGDENNNEELTDI